MKHSMLTFLFTFVLDVSRTSEARYTVHGCKDGQAMLNCRTGTIRVVEVFLADSQCFGSNCCPRAGDCRGATTSTYRNTVYNSCNGRQSCSVDVEIREIGCRWLEPKNDYVNITYDCQAVTSPSPSPSSVLRSTPTVAQVVLSVGSSQSNSQAPPSRAPSAQTPSHFETSTLRGTTIYKYTTLSEVKPNPSNEDRKSEAEARSAAQVDQTNEDYGYLDRVTKIAAVVVVGVVLTAAIVSVAVVIALKKRRAPVIADHYDMPTSSCTTDDSTRNANFYDFIVEPRDSGNCSSASVSAAAEDATKENDYLKPVVDSEDDVHYTWIP